MHHRLKIPANSWAGVLAIAFGLAACQHAGSKSGPVLDRYVADDIAVDSGTIADRPIASLQDVEVELRGLVKSAPNGSTVMYLSHDPDKAQLDSYGNCINLIIDRKLRFNAPAVSDYRFTGTFILVDRLDPLEVHLTYRKIRFDTDCQAFKKPDQYPYFVVRSFQQASER
jgi:hypothetical protein